MLRAHGLRSKGRLIIGIDSGTTRCAVAYSAVTHSLEGLPLSDYRQNKPDIKAYIEWAGYNEGKNNFPTTALYYEFLDWLPTTGHALGSIFDNPDPKSLEVPRLFRLWKLLFHNADDPTTRRIQEPMLRQLALIGKTPQDLLRDWVEVVYRELITEGHLSKLRNLCDDFMELDLEIVVPVPPGRSAIAHDQVLKAFTQRPVSGGQVSLVSEPEALFRIWVHEEKTSEWQVRSTSHSQYLARLTPVVLDWEEIPRLRRRGWYWRKFSINIHRNL